MKARRGDLSGPVLAVLVTLVLLAIGAAIIAYFVLLGAAPLAYTLHRIAMVYLREVEAVESLAYSITLGSATTITLLSLALITRRTR